jgi:hypothetical protein
MQVVSDNFIHGSAATSNFVESEGVLGADSLRISQVTYIKRYYQTALMGVGEVQLQYRYTRDGKISFVGHELFSGGVGDRRGSFILDTVGTVNPDTGVISAEQYLVSESCSSEFAGVSGKGSYVVAKNGYCSFEYTIGI